MKKEYELMVLIKPLLVEDIKERVMSKIEKLAKIHKGEIEVKEMMGKRLLAYPIKSYKEGYYVLYSLKMDSDSTKEFESELKLVDEVIRFLLVKEENL